MNSSNTICATCVSQDRQMFPLPLKHIKLVSMLYKDLMLNKGDKVCWECKHFVIKMAVFRSRALKAQNIITAMMILKEPITPQSLSKLEISTGIFLEIATPQQVAEPTDETPDPLLLDTVKSEYDSYTANSEIDLHFLEEDLFQPETAEVKQEPFIIDTIQSETDLDPNYESGDKGSTEADPASDEFGEEIGASNLNDVTYQVFNHKMMNPGVSGALHNKSLDTGRHEKVQDGNSIANATLLNLLTRKSSQFSFPPLMIKDPTLKLPATEVPTLKPPTIEVPTLRLPTIEVPTLKLPKNPTPATDVENSNETTDNSVPADSQRLIPSFTEERMTEEERLIWWESKKENEYYAKSIDVFRCEKCVEPFFTRRTFLGHIKMHTEVFGTLSCDICELRFKKEVALVAHKDTHYRLLRCTRCAHRWDSPNSMRRHCNTEHSVPIDIWKCDLCPHELRKHYKYLRHTRSHAIEECPDCGKKVSVNCLKVHMSTHTGVDRPYKCSLCDKGFKVKPNLKIHMLFVHAKGDDKAYCTECHKQFKNIYLYNRHMKYSPKHVSKDLLTHKCSECSKVFVSQSLLRLHVNMTHSDELKYPCQVCNQKFKSPQARLRHRREVHENYVAPKNMICDYCGKSFQAKITLAHHINTHTGARPFVCKLCGADFGHKSALYLHGRYKHKIQKKNAKIEKNS